MITPNQIREKKISTAEADGYDRNEVNELLVEIIESYDAVCNENKELYRKLEILAAKIEEYREDEDSIKSAIIIAQKTADKIEAQARESAESTLKESRQSAQQAVTAAQEKADKIVSEARNYVASITQEKAQEAQGVVADAQAKANAAIDSAGVVAQNILSNAKTLATSIVSKAKLEAELYSGIIAKLKQESESFKNSLVEFCNSQLEMINDMPSVIIPDEQYKNIDEIQAELNELMAGISEPVIEQEPEQDLQQEVEAEPEQEMDNEPEQEVEAEPEQEMDNEPEQEVGIESEQENNDNQIDEIIEELEDIPEFEMIEDDEEFDEPQDDMNDTQEEKASYTQEEIDDAINAFTSNTYTPINDDNASIPLIEDEPEFENALPFESFFNVNREPIGDETISLTPPDEDDDDDQGQSKFKGFFKKKK